jgi:parallel beta-helix repeat protein
MAQETIFIHSDGSIEGTERIQREGNIYTFSDNIVNQSIVVEINKIIIDGNDYLLFGNGTGAGIYLDYQNNVTVKNVQINNFSCGIGLFGSHNNTISNVLLVNHGVGLSLTASDNNTFNGNTLMSNGQGFYLFMCYNNCIYNNSFINNTKQVFDNWFINPGLPKELESVNIWYMNTTGNYWSDYNGTDNNDDGIGDTPYIINNLNLDNYPLIAEFIIPEFSSWIILPLIIGSTLIVIIVKNQIGKRN